MHHCRVVKHERDQAWAAMYTAAERLTSRYCQADTLKVAAYQRRNLTNVVQGLQVWDDWTDYDEPVRERRYFSKKWHELQPVQEAASKIGSFLRERPDQSD
jgi:hypothetical protein